MICLDIDALSDIFYGGEFMDEWEVSFAVRTDDMASDRATWTCSRTPFHSYFATQLSFSPASFLLCLAMIWRGGDLLYAFFTRGK